jgi:hypothetical protein
VSLGVGGAARPLKGERDVGGKCPNAGLPIPGAGEPNVAAVASMRSAQAAALAGGKRPRESPRPAGVPGKLPVPMPPDGERRPERGGGAEADE